MAGQPVITIEHSGDGTLVYGTERGDTEAIAALKAAGFRWGRSISAWYLPRTWGEPTRAHRVRQVKERLGDRVQVEQGDLARTESAEEIAQRRVEGSRRRAERLSEKADRLEADSDGYSAGAKRITDGIPFGQPILVGHHSERRHRRDLDRAHDLMGKSVQAHRDATETARAAEAAESNADSYDSRMRVFRRLDRDQRELRRLVKIRDGSGKAIYGHDRPATGGHRERLEAMITDLTAKIERDQTVVADNGWRVWGPDEVQVGDVVIIRHYASVVVSMGPTNVTVDTGHGLTIPYPWYEVTGHKAREAVPSE